MHRCIVTLLILLMTVLPIKAAAVYCHDVPGKAVATDIPMSMSMLQRGDRHCCPDRQQPAPEPGNDACPCDQFQHVQIILSLPPALAAVPASRFAPAAPASRLVPERTDLLYRPPLV